MPKHVTSMLQGSAFFLPVQDSMLVSPFRTITSLMTSRHNHTRRRRRRHGNPSIYKHTGALQEDMGFTEAFEGSFTDAMAQELEEIRSSGPCFSHVHPSLLLLPSLIFELNDIPHLGTHLDKSLLSKSAIAQRWKRKFGDYRQWRQIICG